MFDHSQEIPLHDLPVMPILTNVETGDEGKSNSHPFTYGMDIPLDRLSEF